MPSGLSVRAGTKIISRGLLVSIWVMISIKFCAGAKRLDRARLSFALCDGSYCHKALEINTLPPLVKS